MAIPVPPATYGSTSPRSAPFHAPFFSTPRTSARSFYATRRPWRELVQLASFTRPPPLANATLRIKLNLNYFRVNYAMIILFILFLSLLWHPVSMIVFIIVFVAWFFLYFFRDEPLMILGRTIDDRWILGLLGILTVVALVLTHVWLNVLVSVSIGAFLVVLHAAFRGRDDLYSDEQDDGEGGLFSVVGSPTRAGYSSI